MLNQRPVAIRHPVITHTESPNVPPLISTPSTSTKISPTRSLSLSTSLNPGLTTSTPTPWPLPWAGRNPTMSRARRRRLLWSVSSLPLAGCCSATILGKTDHRFLEPFDVLGCWDGACMAVGKHTAISKTTARQRVMDYGNFFDVNDDIHD